MGIALSPDGSKMAVSDDGVNAIYLLNTSTLTVTSTFTLPNTGLDAGNLPCGLAISDSGIVYYATYQPNGGGNNTFHRLDTNTGIVTAYPSEPAFNQYDQYDSHVLITKDNASVYYLGGDVGFLSKVSTATDQAGYVPAVYEANSDMALSADGTTLSAGNVFFDTEGKPHAYFAQNWTYWSTERIAVDGQEFSADGKLLFLPQEQSIEVVDVATALRVQRIALPVYLSLHFDALVSDGTDDILVAMTDPGDGIALIDLSSVPQSLSRPGSVMARTLGPDRKSVPLVTTTPVVRSPSKARATRRRTFGALRKTININAIAVKSVPVKPKLPLSPE